MQLPLVRESDAARHNADPRQALATSTAGLFGKVSGRVAVAEAPGHYAAEQLRRTLIPRPEQPPGQVRARLEREYGVEERPPAFATSFMERDFGPLWRDGRLSGEHGVIGIHTADATMGMTPPDIYAGPVWRRRIPTEWSQGLVRD